MHFIHHVLNLLRNAFPSVSTRQSVCAPSPLYVGTRQRKEVGKKVRKVGGGDIILK
jgi:hypothetical protein